MEGYWRATIDFFFVNAWFVSSSTARLVTVCPSSVFLVYFVFYFVKNLCFSGPCRFLFCISLTVASIEGDGSDGRALFAQKYIILLYSST